jgi:hypothetical protein
MAHLDERTLVVGLLVCFALLTTCFLSTNEAPRFALSLSLGIQGEWHIDSFFPEVLHPLFPPIDYVKKDGHIYSDKGPLLSVLAAPIVRILQMAGADLRTTVYVTTLLLAGLPTALTALLIFWFGRSVHRPGDIDPTLVALAYALCTNAFYYGTVFFPYSMASFLAVASFWVVHAGDRYGDVRGGLAAGALAGLSGLADFATLLLFPGLLLYCVLRRPRWTVPFLVSGGLMLSLLPLYAYAMLGDPFGLPYKYHATFANTREQGVWYQWGIPDPQAPFGVTLSSERGLFFYSPVLIVAAVLWFRFRALHPHEAYLVMAMFIVLMGFHITHSNWRAGISFGPRYMTAAMPFFVLPLLAVRRMGAVWPVFMMLLLISFLVNLVGAVSHYPGDKENPVAGLLAKWYSGRRLMMDAGEGEPYEIIVARPKVHLVLYHLGLDGNEALVRLPSLLVCAAGLVLLRRAMV